MQIKYRVYEYNKKEMYQVASMGFREGAVYIISYIDSEGNINFPIIEKCFNIKHDFSPPMRYSNYKTTSGVEVYVNDTVELIDGSRWTVIERHSDIVLQNDIGHISLENQIITKIVL